MTGSPLPSLQLPLEHTHTHTNTAFFYMDGGVCESSVCFTGAADEGILTYLV